VRACVRARARARLHFIFILHINYNNQSSTEREFKNSNYFKCSAFISLFLVMILLGHENNRPLGTKDAIIFKYFNVILFNLHI